MYLVEMGFLIPCIRLNLARSPRFATVYKMDEDQPVYLLETLHIILNHLTMPLF